jgi:hypothetical protein
VIISYLECLFTMWYFIYYRPALYLPSPEKVTIAVRCCPTKFQLRKIQRKQNEGKHVDTIVDFCHIIIR